MNQIQPDFTAFERLARSGDAKLIPLYRQMVADLDTPLSVYRKLASEKPSFLLESAEGGERWGRYSIIGVGAREIVRCKNRRVEIIRGDGREIRDVEGNPLDIVREKLLKSPFAQVPGLPKFFGGAVGYLAYDSVRYFEKLPDKLPDDLECYDFEFIFTNRIVVFDNVTRQMTLVTVADLDAHPTPERARAVAAEELMEMVATVKGQLPELPDAPGGELTVHPNTPQADYERAVRMSKEYIAAGDIFQVVLSQRFTANVEMDAFQLYRALRVVNPSPYLFLLEFDGYALVGSSPEVLVRLDGDEVTVRPIAGTLPRGKTLEEDLSNEKKLLADPKERAEHIMLVDLGRNDVGRVAAPGSVKVSDLMVIEKYSHVMHIVSNVIGKLAPGKDAFDVLTAAFPAGTLSGAPKIRAMEIIDEMERSRRGWYGGAVGYFSPTGEMDFCIAIRTFYLSGKQVHWQAGAGIVADSVPESEHKECLAKSAALRRALEMAMKGLS